MLICLFFTSARAGGGLSALAHGGHHESACCAGARQAPVVVEQGRRHDALGFEDPEPRVARRVGRVAVDLVVEPAVVRRREHERGGVVPEPAGGEGAVVEAAEVEGVALAVGVLHEADDERAGRRDELHAHRLRGPASGPEHHEAGRLGARGRSALCVHGRVKVVRHGRAVSHAALLLTAVPCKSCLSPSEGAKLVKTVKTVKTGGNR